MNETAREKRHRKNRLHLADMLENRITDKQFNMTYLTNECGTVGCALGIAAMSGEFGYGWNPVDGGIAVKDGMVAWWTDVGKALFGAQATCQVFFNPVYACSDRETVAQALRDI